MTERGVARMIVRVEAVTVLPALVGDGELPREASPAPLAAFRGGLPVEPRAAQAAAAAAPAATTLAAVPVAAAPLPLKLKLPG